MSKYALAAVVAVTLAAPTIAVLTPDRARAEVRPRSTPKGPTCTPKSALKGITAAFDGFLGAASAADRVRLVDQGAKIQDAVGKSFRVALASGREQPPLQNVATDLEVTCTAKTRATFTFDLQIKQGATGATTPPLGLHQPGDAVLRKATWYVTAATACAFTALNPDPANQAPVADCYRALGRPVPVPTT